MHRIIIFGNVGRDAELRSTGNGKQVLNFPIASGNGKKTDGTDRPLTWFDCTLWEGEALKFQGIKKGDNLEITGRVTAEAWLDQASGNAKGKIAVNVSGISPSAAPNQAPPAHHEGGGTGGPGGGGGDLDDEIPF